MGTYAQKKHTEIESIEIFERGHPKKKIKIWASSSDF